MSDYISRQAAIDEVNKYFSRIGKLKRHGLNNAEKAINLDIVNAIDTLPSADVPEIVRCKDCRWFERFDNSKRGYCHAAKHGHYSSHWEIHINRVYDEDFYCADAERI